ncbi:MAG TPA: hypothetical protein VJT74_17240 [Pyrinomonadaceae bacterium]|nr:hypothetical protein [Pyrinomonadaceae bacterium]
MRKFTLAVATITLLSFACAKGGNTNQVGAAATAPANSSAAAATPAPTAAGPAFTSDYTDLNKDCKAAFKESEIGEGQDMPLKCKGYGGYYVSIGYSAMASHVGVQKEGDDDSLIGLVNQGIGYSDEPGRKVEWRMADGKPFAVIIRATSYDVPKAEEKADSPYKDKYKTGETLIVKGLKGYEQIDFTVDAKTPNANEKAREMADSNFVKK